MCQYLWFPIVAVNWDKQTWRLNARKLLFLEDYTYYQVQMQLVLCEVSYCDFVVRTPKGIVNIRIKPDEPFFKEINPKLDDFFQQCILP